MDKKFKRYNTAILVKIKMPGGPAFFGRREWGRTGGCLIGRLLIICTVLGKKMEYAGEVI